MDSKAECSKNILDKNKCRQNNHSTKEEWINNDNLKDDGFYFFEMVCVETDPMAEFYSIQQSKETKVSTLKNNDCLEYYLK